MRPMRNPAIQGLLSRLMASWMRLCISTIRWRRENQQLAEALWAGGGPVILVFWHARVGMAPGCWPLDRAQPLRAVISLSSDGQFIADTVARLGFPAIRGSSGKKNSAKKSKGGLAALRESVRWLKQNGAVAITPDGPRGPAREMGEGLALMARLSGAPVLMVGLSSKPAIRLKTWDRAVLPMPFGRGAMVWDVVRIGPDAEPASVVAEWTARLNAVEDRADAITGLK